jgi:hypothetical protein
MNSQRLYNLSLQSLSQKNTKTITIVQLAMPAASSNVIKALLYGALVSIAIIFIFIFRAYFNIHYRDHIELLIPKNKQ